MTSEIEAVLPSGRKIHWSGDIAGFGVRVNSDQTRSFIFNYRVRGTGKERRLTIGSASVWTIEGAREEAKRLRKAVDLGGDPMGDIHTKRRALTVAELIDRFVAEYLPRLEATSQKVYRLTLKNYVRPTLGDKRVDDVERADIVKLFDNLTARDHLSQANQVVRMCGILFAFAIEKGWRSRYHPAREIKMHNCRRKPRLNERAIVRAVRELGLLDQ